MCGICGKILKDPRKPVEEGLIKRMCSRLEHRGPDDSGIYIKEGAGLGHRRLSVIDLTPGAAQPLANEDNTLFLAVNGEIYNYIELKKELEPKGHRFKTASDAEIILHMYEEYGLDCFVRMEGMFSCVIWDSEKRELVAARDRMGQKPFFYYHNDTGITFASEIEALLEDRTVPRVVNPRGVFDYFSYGYVPSPQTAFKHLHRLSPAHYLVWTDGRIRIKRYWNLSFRKQEFIGSEEEVIQQVRERMHAGVALRLRSDVDVGIFLSGGIDSGVIAAEAAARQGNLRAFSVSFSDQEYNEAEYAAEIAEMLGIKHLVIRTEADISGFLPLLARRYGDLFADSSSIPSYFISKAASKYVKVVLSGDGGDEMFGGYYRYRAFKYQTLFRIIPGFIKYPLFRAGAMLGKHAPRNSFRRYAGIELSSEMYLTHLMVESGCWDFSEKAMAADIFTYLPGDLLQKIDISSMANGLEVRSPFLDNGLVEYVASLPAAYKINRATHKYILKKAYAGLLPETVLKRKKMGFAVPLTSYIRNGLYSLIMDCFSSRDAFIRQVFLDETVDAAAEQIRTEAINPPFVFSLLMCELWHREFFRGLRTGTV